jgi:hypothetical protein
VFGVEEVSRGVAPCGVEFSNRGLPSRISARPSPPPRVGPTVHHVVNSDSLVSPGFTVTRGTIFKSGVFVAFCSAGVGT